MKTQILGCLLLLFMMQYAQAQTYHSIQHAKGTAEVHGTLVTVKQTGHPRTGGGVCSEGGYWIGYNEHNGYEMLFDKPVSKLRVRLTIINKGEQIKLTVNQKPYALTDKDLQPFNGNCVNVPVAVMENGLITSKYNYANTEIIINPGTGISQLGLEHTNGDKGGAGTACEVAIVDEGSGNMNGSPATGIGSMTGNGWFSMLPNPATDKVTIGFLPTANGSAHINITDVAGKLLMSYYYNCEKGVPNTQILDVKQLVPGSYYVELTNGSDKEIAKLVKL